MLSRETHSLKKTVQRNYTGRVGTLRMLYKITTEQVIVDTTQITIYQRQLQWKGMLSVSFLSLALR